MLNGKWWLGLLLAALVWPVQAALSVRDAQGSAVTLAAPAQRIVALAPHTVELAYAAGAGSKLVAAVEYSDYPPAALRLPRVGSLSGISLEAVLRMRPDLVLVWADGIDPRLLAALRARVAVFVSRPLLLGQVADEIEDIGVLAGSAVVAKSAATRYRGGLAALSAQYRQRAPLSVFYQVSERPLFTISDNSFLGQAISLCGGRNVFGALSQPAPQVSEEAVLRARPQVMLARNMAEMGRWRRWPVLPAVAHATLYDVREDALSRPGPRLLDGVQQLCARLDEARRTLGLTGR